MPSLKFKKKKENFVCENCSEKVSGDGYTNHCPHCLWSKHVDIFPGDRAENCDGLMEPIDKEKGRGKWSIIYQCLGCGVKRKNKIAKEDNFDRLIKIKEKN